MGFATDPPARGALANSRAAAWLAAGALLLALPARGGTLADARRLLDAGEPVQARQVLERLVAAPDVVPEAWVLLTAARNALEDHRAAVASGRRAVRLLPDSAEAHYRFAEALRIRMAQVGRLRAMFSVGAYRKALARALELDPRHVLAHREEIGYLTFAPGVAGGDTARARERIAELMRIDPQVGLACRAELAAREEDFEAAVRDYRTLLAAHPADREARMRLALWLHRLGRDAEADRHLARLAGGGEPARLASLLERHVASLPDDVRSKPVKSAAYSRLAAALVELGRHRDAALASSRALALDPANPRAEVEVPALNGRR